MGGLGGAALAPLAGPLQTPHKRGPMGKFVRFLRSPRGSQGGSILPCSPQYTPRIATGRGAPHRRRSCTYRSLPLPRQVEPRFFPTSYLLDAFLRLDEKGIVKPGESKKGLEMGDPGPTPTPNTAVRRPHASAHRGPGGECAVGSGEITHISHLTRCRHSITQDTDNT